MVDYPKKLNIIFDKLLKNSLKPIIVGGYVRDSLLNIDSKDIDIELYGRSSFKELEDILQEFGDVNSVGKSFGVCKLKIDNLDLDFSFARIDTKINKGHKGFSIKIDSDLDFKTATSRRDFTINAIGYDIETKEILDPFNGVKDLQNRVLKAVDTHKFQEDPLRVLRAVQFSSRFNLTIDAQLLFICQNMIKNSLLEELPRERIFIEIQKLLLKSPKPSTGIITLKQFGAFGFFKELRSLEDHYFFDTLESLDKMASLKTTNKQLNSILMLAVLCHRLEINKTKSFLLRLSSQKSLINKILTLLATRKSFHFKNNKDYDIYLLATKVSIYEFTFFSLAIAKSQKELESILQLRDRAEALHILNTKAKNLLQGKDILALGIEPSKEFSKILEKAYIAQISGEFTTKQEALLWLKKELGT